MSAPGSEVFIGVDLGTSSLKAVALTSTGELVGRASESYPTQRPEPQASEQDPAAWLAAFGTAMRQLSEQVPQGGWAALGLSAMIPTLVATDDEGDPVRPAITWEDARAEPEGSRLRDQVGAERLYRETGQWVDGRYLLPMLLRIASADPLQFQRVRWMLGAKDYLFWHLTGTRVTDPSTATGFGCYGLQSDSWLQHVQEAAEVVAGAPMPGLPSVRPSTHSAPVTEAASRELQLPPGLPIVLGAADSVLAAHGLGVREIGDVAYVAGTSTVVLGVSTTPDVDSAHRYLVTPMAYPGSWGLEMDQLATGSALRWLGELMGMSEADVVERAGASTSKRPPLFLPYVAPGEQGALWDPSLTGSVTGLTLEHTSADVARALLTGLILESRRSLEVLAEATGVRGDIRITGSGASSSLFQRDLADASGRSVMVASGGDHSAIGAAMVAASGSALGGTEGSAEPTRIVRPDPRSERAWIDRARVHDEALHTQRELNEMHGSGERDGSLTPHMTGHTVHTK